jgi:hypothetical protein
VGSVLKKFMDEELIDVNHDKADNTMHTHPNLLLRLPKKKSTTPVTPQAAPNNCSDEASGNKPGNTT